MSDWLFKDDEYSPPKDNDKFINKSIVGILEVLSIIKREQKNKTSFIYRLNPVAKFICTMLIIILLSLSRSLIYISIIVLYMILLLSSLHGEEIKKILALTIIVPIFTLIMLIPSIIMGNFNNSLIIVLKLIGSIMAVNILSYTTKWHNITKALKKLFIPDIFIFVLDITIRYIVLLGEFSLNMLYALKLRSIGRNDKKYFSLTKIMGTLFMKSKEMGEEMFSAMECRGFTGEYNLHSNFKFTSIDILYLLLNIILFILYFYFNRM